VFALHSQLSLGVDAFGATNNRSSLPDGQFVAWLGQFQWARRLGIQGTQLILRTDIQLTPDPLLSLEQFTVGGGQSVRGYRENQLVRDNGAVGSVESRISLMQNPQGQDIVQVAPFADAGGAWATRGRTPDPKYLASVGLGLRWAITRDVNFQVYWGYPLKDVDASGHDLQDYGIHFRLSSKFALPEGIADTLPPRGQTRPGAAGS
jgi:hemolysin activation/secretion protein